ncbi:hypothetical protein DENSPDRAFT_665459 [Dentipellis sp. KUC8613]|nr:hypothetical protein DENSPDRAFT_665459 [Dentipellis sp. KUC8613]
MSTTPSPSTILRSRSADPVLPKTRHSECPQAYQTIRPAGRRMFQMHKAEDFDVAPRDFGVARRPPGGANLIRWRSMDDIDPGLQQLVIREEVGGVNSDAEDRKPRSRIRTTLEAEHGQAQGGAQQDIERKAIGHDPEVARTVRRRGGYSAFKFRGRGRTAGYAIQRRDQTQLRLHETERWRERVTQQAEEARQQVKENWWQFQAFHNGRQL